MQQPNSPGWDTWFDEHDEDAPDLVDSPRRSRLLTLIAGALLVELVILVVAVAGT